MSDYKSAAKSTITKGQISVIKMAQGKLGITDDDYRTMLQERFKAKSCKELTFNQAGALIEELQRKGFVLVGAKTVGAGPVGAVREPPLREPPLQGESPRVGNEPQDLKIRAMWLSLYDCGIVRDPSTTAMLAFVKRQTGLDALPWCSVAEKSNVIESLKKMGDK